MASRIKPIKATIIKDRKVWEQILTEVQQQPTADVVRRHERGQKVLRMLRR